MSARMRAVRIHGKEDVRLESVGRPQPGAGEVLIEITAAGICGTDASLFRHGIDLVPPPEPALWPIVLGHEFAGRVAAVGERVEGLAVGDLVASGAGVSCGKCRHCRAGRTNLCAHYWTAGIHRDGGLAEFCTVPAATCELTLPHGVGGDAIGLAQPMAIAVHAIDRGRPTDGERALILGAGGIGAFATWVASQSGLEVTVCDRDPARLAIAARLGAVESILAEDRPLDEQLAESVDFDIVYEMTGAPSPLAAALRLVRPAGRLVAVGVQAVPPTLNMAYLTVNEIELIGTSALVRAVDLPRSLDLLAAREAGWADVAPTVYSLDDVVAEALPALVAGAAEQIKALVDPRLEVSRAYAG